MTDDCNKLGMGHAYLDGFCIECGRLKPTKSPAMSLDTRPNEKLIKPNPYVRPYPGR